MQRLFVLSIGVLGLLAVAGCSSQANRESAQAEASPAQSVQVEPTGNMDSADPSDGKSFKVLFKTSKGDFTVEVHPEWAPHGAARFKGLVKAGFYNGCRFFRVVPDFMVQWGINGNPEMQAVWRDRTIPDDAVRQSNTRGRITFAKTNQPNSRSTQVFINFKDNSFLDRDGFAPFGEVIEGMPVVDDINSEYGERPSQELIQRQGNDYLKQQFPNLDYIISAEIVE